MLLPIQFNPACRLESCRGPRKEEVMQLFKVYNGFVGFSDTRCYVVAETEGRALELAREKFEAENPDYEGYYTDLSAEVIFTDCSVENVSAVMDE